MTTKKILATILVASMLLSTAGCKCDDAENISVSFSDVLKEYGDDTLLDEVLMQSDDESCTLDEIAKVEEYIKLVEQIAKLNIPTPQNVSESTILKYQNMSVDEVYYNIEKQLIVLGTGSEILEREAGLNYLSEYYQKWLKENAPSLTKRLLQKALATAYATVDETTSSTYDLTGIDEKILYTSDISSVQLDLDSTTYVINENSGTISSLATSYYELEQLSKSGDRTYEQVAQACLRAMDSVKTFVATELENNDQHIIGVKTKAKINN